MDPNEDFADDLDLNQGEESEVEQPEGEGQGEPPSEGQEGTAFYDASKVPEALRPTFLEMQKAFTQKTQAIAGQRANIEGLAAKAQTLDQLLQRKEFVDLLYQMKSKDFQGPQEEYPNLDPEVVTTIQSLIQRELSRVAAPLQDRQAMTEALIEKEQFVKAYPDWEQYRDRMTTAFQRNAHNPKFTFEDAYFWARGQAAQEHRSRAAVAADRAKRSVERPGTSRPAPRAEKITSFQDAVNAALNELGMKRSE